jgi:hypothetical protein
VSRDEAITFAHERGTNGPQAEDAALDRAGALGVGPYTIQAAIAACHARAGNPARGLALLDEVAGEKVFRGYPQFPAARTRDR